MSYPDVWSEKAYVTLTKQGGSDVSFESIVETIDIDEGNYPVDQTANLAGGRIISESPKEMTTVTFEGYPLGVSTEDGETELGFSQQANATSDTTQPLSTSPTIGHDKYRLAILWTNDSSVSDAASEVSTGAQGYRYIAKDAYVMPPAKEFTDGQLKFTVEVMCPAFDKSGTSLITEESTNGDSSMPALSSYT